MTSQLIITLAILAFMIVMFVWQKFPMGVTTMTCCALLAAFGILSPRKRSAASPTTVSFWSLP